MAVVTEEAIKALSEGESFLQTVLQDPKYKKYRNAYLVYKIAKPLYMSLRTRTISVHREQKYSYKLENGSYLYILMANWMKENLPPTQLNYYEVEVQNAQVINDGETETIIPDNDLLANTTSDFYDEDGDETMVERRSILIPHFSFAPDAPKFFTYQGERIELGPEGEPDPDDDDDLKKRRQKVSYYTDFVLTAEGDRGREAIEALLTDILVADQDQKSQGKEKRRGTVFTLRRGGGDWTNRNKVPPRNFQNVFLPEQMRTDLVEDVRKFMALRNSYERLGLPYHRGYLLYGPPGTGKTSVVQAVANEFSMNLYCMSLADVKNDSELIELFHNVRQGKSIVLIEDIDAVNLTAERNSTGEHQGVTLSGLLNALDGVTSASGLIVFMTTNDRTRLDPALIRPGRCDFTAEISYIVEEQYKGFFNLFFRQDPLTDFDFFDFRNVAPVEVMECFKRYPLDIVQADAFLKSQFSPGIKKSQREKINAISGVSGLVGDSAKDAISGKRAAKVQTAKSGKKAKKGKNAPKAK